MLDSMGNQPHYMDRLTSSFEKKTKNEKTMTKTKEKKKKEKHTFNQIFSLVIFCRTLRMCAVA